MLKKEGGTIIIPLMRREVGIRITIILKKGVNSKKIMNLFQNGGGLRNPVWSYEKN